MASAMDSGVDTGNDSNDSAVQDKLSKMDLEDSQASKSSFLGQEKDISSDEDKKDQFHTFRTSEIVVAPSSLQPPIIKFPALRRRLDVLTSRGSSQSCFARMMQLDPRHNVTLVDQRTIPVDPMSVTELNSRKLSEMHQSAIINLKHLVMSAMHSSEVSGGGPFGTEYKGNPLVTKITRRLRTHDTMMRHKCLRNAFGNTSLANYAKIRDTMRMTRAACHNNTDAMREMLEAGISPNCQDNFKRTPLHLASCMGYADMVKLLLDYGADPNMKDSIGNTPLHLAACTNHVNVITLLLKAGTRVSERDMAGHSPLQLAITKFNIIKRSDVPHPVLKDQVCQVINMLTEYMRRKEGASVDPDLLNKFESLVRVSDSSQEVESNIRDLLSNLSTLSLSGPS